MNRSAGEMDGYRTLIAGESRGIAPALVRGLLRVLSWPYALATWTRNLAYDRGWRATVHAVRPVVSVGNLTVGGTGKTPFVELVAKLLRVRGVRVAILSRGYGATDGANDEALLLDENLPDVPHLQSADRVAIARVACEELDSQVLLLDDGLQHRRLHRDLNIVLLDATDPFGCGFQLPRGLLRESPAALRRADLIVLTRCDLLSPQQRDVVRGKVLAIAGPRPWIEVRFEPTFLVRYGHDRVPVESLSQRRVLAFCGIGNPSAFWQTIGRLGCEVLDRRAFPDHYDYLRSDVVALADWVRGSRPDLLITTQKDLVKLRVGEIGGVPLGAVRIEAHIEAGAELLDNALTRICSLAQAK